MHGLQSETLSGCWGVAPSLVKQTGVLQGATMVIQALVLSPNEKGAL